MALKHIKEVACSAGEVLQGIRDTLNKIVEAFTNEDMDSEVLAKFLKIKSSLDSAVQNIDASLALWKQHKLEEVMQEYDEEIAQYDKLLLELERDKSPNAPEVIANISSARISLIKLKEYLILIKEIGNLPNKKEKYSKFVFNNKQKEKQILFNELLVPLRKGLSELNEFIKEEIEE
jgi:hypothetical protein